jgi:hypothetical protein
MFDILSPRSYRAFLVPFSFLLRVGHRLMISTSNGKRFTPGFPRRDSFCFKQRDRMLKFAGAPSSMVDSSGSFGVPART